MPENLRCEVVLLVHLEAYHMIDFLLSFRTFLFSLKLQHDPQSFHFIHFFCKKKNKEWCGARLLNIGAEHSVG